MNVTEKPTDEDFARLMANRVMAYWAKSGHAVKAWAAMETELTTKDGKRVWSVRSDMVNGYPVGWREA